MRYMVLLVLALIIPSDCVQESDQSVILRDFDLLLLTDRNVVILKNGTENQELRLPSFPSTTNDTANAEKHPTTYTSVAADAESNLLYFTPGNAHIAVLNVTSGLTSLVYSTDDSSSISELSFSDNALYWIEDQVVIKSSSNNHDITHINESSNGRIQGLAISPSSIYYTLWSKTARTGEIRYLNGTSNGTVLPNLPLPKSLFTDGSRLIWANNPPGIHFTIESSNLESKDPPTILMRQAHHHASSLTVHCGVIYWTDVDGKRLWEVERTVKKSRSPQSTEVSIPGYSFTSVQTLGKGCHEQPVAESPVIKPVTSSSESSNTEVAPPHPEVKASRLLNTPVTAPPVKLTSAPVRFCSSEETKQITCTSAFCLVINSAPTCLYDTTRSPSYLSTPEPSYSWNTSVVATVSILGTVATIMSLFSVYMTVRVRNLTLKPIIRRRVVVSRRTSESSHSNSPTSVCEMIDIENCCNMNVCETPCYERTLIPSSSNPIISVNSSNGNWSNKTDKSCLLK